MRTRTWSSNWRSMWK